MLQVLAQIVGDPGEWFVRRDVVVPDPVATRKLVEVLARVHRYVDRFEQIRGCNHAELRLLENPEPRISAFKHETKIG